jgi:RNA polymerase sigma-70 factor (ECF subfamily)
VHLPLTRLGNFETNSPAVIDPDQFRNRLVTEVPGLLRYAHTLVSAPADAEDLVQDTVVEALENGSSFRGESSLATWLHRVFHNIAIDRSRRSRERPLADAEDFAQGIELLWQDDSYTVDAATVLERAEVREELQDALLRLPLIYRSAVALHDAEGLAMAEVADIQGVALPAAKQRLRRGRMMLVSELAQGADHVDAQDVPLGCWDARSRVSDYLDAELSNGDRTLLEQHLSHCPTCPPLYASLVGTRVMLERRRDPDEVVPARLAERIRATLARDEV